jgi:hypothetical protein
MFGQITSQSGFFKKWLKLAMRFMRFYDGLKTITTKNIYWMVDKFG